MPWISGGTPALLLPAHAALVEHALLGDVSPLSLSGMSTLILQKNGILVLLTGQQQLARDAFSLDLNLERLLRSRYLPGWSEHRPLLLRGGVPVSVMNLPSIGEVELRACSLVERPFDLSATPVSHCAIVLVASLL